MRSFCIDQIRIEPGLRAEHGVMRSASFAVTTRARVVAADIERRAEAEREAVLRAARDEAGRIVQEAETKVFEQAARLLELLAQMQGTVVDRAQDIVVDLACSLLDRLVLQMTPREKVEATLRRLLAEAPPKLVEPVLRVHPEDAEHLPAVDWEIKKDDTMARGACRLEATDGKWCADFGGALDALRNAFRESVSNPVDVSN
jgi:flagellar biosynthesis/type III secretory pathway protein FliH